MEEKIQRTFIREEAYLKLRDWILEGKLAPGAQLKDKELAQQLGVSRTPIREALLKLEDEGFVITKPNRSTQVSPIEIKDAYPLYSIVWTLEKLALNQAYESITNDHIEKMAQANERFLKKMKNKDRLGALEADHEFHSIYIEISHNKELEKIITDIKQKLKRLDLYYFDKVKNALLSYEEHQQIIESLRKKDLSAALKAVEHNWKASFSQGFFMRLLLRLTQALDLDSPRSSQLSSFCFQGSAHFSPASAA
ncbi:MAG: GntR family transcriptional regulator [Verrucomicrobiota bacterium]|nr:GntR family transcriptional regulator [Verrucomicrobiota bacterium]